jgi:hypothetical protein
MPVMKVDVRIRGIERLKRELARPQSTCLRPVALVPEQALIASVRHNMVDHCCRYQAPLRPAGGAQRV